MHLWQFTHFSLSTEITERYFPVCVFRFFVISNSVKSDLVNLIRSIYNENCFSSSIDVFYILFICAPTDFIDIVRKKFIIMQNFVKGVYKNAVY